MTNYLRKRQNSSGWAKDSIKKFPQQWASNVEQQKEESA